MTGPANWERIQEIFAGALAVALDQRGSYVAKECGGDHVMREQVELLLASHDRARSFLETPPAPAALHLEGKRIGGYEVVSRIGAGGMGEVYRARDLKLGREVAIKTLPPLFTRDRERLARFEREARVLAALNHPHIGAIYGFEESIGDAGSPATPALVLELVEGDTLAERIASQRSLPTVDALRIASQIGEALEAAHEKGIVHRDLKPSNIKITPGGVVKVLDFGLAKAAMGDDRSNQHLSHSPTMTLDGTRAGMILGTAAYMSPEQARGGVVDKRTDIWAFGCVLYEMLTGRAAFAKDTTSDTIAAVLEREPDWNALPRATPAKIRDLLRRCLQKDATRRLHDIADARIDIEDVGLARTGAHVNGRVWATLAAAVAVALAAAAYVWFRPAPRSTSSGADWVPLTNFPDSATQPALSPDGRMLTFIRGEGTFTTDGQIYVKLLPDGEPIPLTNDKLTKMGPVFSPDGSRIAYSVVDNQDSQWSTWVVPTLRGDPHLWLRNSGGLTWIDKSQLLYSEIKQGLHMAIATSPDNRGGARDVYVPEHQNGMAHRAYLAPDKQSVLVVEMDERSAWLPCRLVPFDGGSAGRPVGPPNARCTEAAWAPDGRWMYFTADTGDGFHLWRQAYPDGQPEQLTSGITQEEGLAIAPGGTSLITSVGLRRRAIFVHAANGDERQIPAEGYAFWPVLSADGQRLCYRVTRSAVTGQVPTELWMTELATGRNERLFPGQLVTSYDLSRDGRLLAGVRDSDGKNRVWTAWLDGREPPRQVATLEGDNPRFVGADIVFRAQEGATMFLFLVKTDGTGMRKLPASAAVSSVIGSGSADGKWVAGYASRSGSSGNGGVLYSTTGEEAVVVIPNSSGVRIRWAPDGTRLYISIPVGAASAFGSGRTYVVPTEPGSMLPRMPVGGFQSEADLAAAPGVQMLPYGDVTAGPSASIYAYSRETVTRNLYRIPLP